MLIRAVKVYSRRENGILKTNVFTHHEAVDLDFNIIYNCETTLDEYFCDIAEDKTICESIKTKPGSNLIYAWLDMAIDHEHDLPLTLRSIETLDSPSDSSPFPYRKQFHNGVLEFGCQQSINGDQLRIEFRELIDKALGQFFYGKGLIQ